MFFMILEINFALTLSYNIKMKCFVTLLDYDIIWLFDTGNYIFYQIVNDCLVSLENRINFKRTYEDMSHHLSLQTR